MQMKPLHFIVMLVLLLMVVSFSCQKPSDKSAEPKVYLNHLYITLDQDIYKDIAVSEFLKDEFAAGETRKTVGRDSEQWTGTYLYGENTYMEFLEISDAFNEGMAGVAFGLENRGEIDLIQSSLEEKIDTELIQGIQTRRLDDRDIPWFHTLSRSSDISETAFFTWIMEYHQDFLPNWHPELGPDIYDMRRSTFLERYVAKIGKGQLRRSQYFKDIAEVTVALTAEEAKSFIDELEVYGFRIRSENETKICEGPDITFTITNDEKSAMKIRKLKINLYKNKQGTKTYRFGENSVLQFEDDKTAIWLFDSK